MAMVYLQKVDFFWRHHSEAETQPLQALLISPSLDGAGQQLHCVVRSLLVIHLLLHSTQVHQWRYDPRLELKQ